MLMLEVDQNGHLPTHFYVRLCGSLLCVLARVQSINLDSNFQTFIILGWRDGEMEIDGKGMERWRDREVGGGGETMEYHDVAIMLHVRTYISENTAVQ